MESARTNAPVGGAPPTAAAPANLHGLGNRFVALFARRLPRDAFAVEISRLIFQALRARAVAVLGYETRRDRLVLLADEGLSDEARSALGGGSDCPWDIPLRGLRNRRISVIAGAHHNPFVPRALVNLAPRGLTVASLPIYNDHEPVGALVLFAAGNRSFADSQLQTLSQALRACAPGLREVDGSGTRSGPAAQPENVEATIAKLIAAGAIIDPAAASAALQPAGPAPAAATTHTTAAQQMMDDLIARVQGLERELAKAQDEVDGSTRRTRSLTMASNALARERDGLARQLADIEGGHGTEVSELRTELAAVQERLLAVESERARTHRLSEGRSAAAKQSIGGLEKERDTLSARAQAAEANVAELQTLLAAVFDERDRLAARVETLTIDLRSGQEAWQRSQSDAAQERTALEADREGWKEETATVRAQLAQRTEQLTGIEHELRSTVVARDGATTQLTGARAELDRLTALGDELAQTTTQIEAARAGIAAENTSLRRTLDEERGTRLRAEEALRGALTATRADVERLSSTAETLRGELAERGRTVAERDEQLTQLRQEQEAARQAETTWQQATAALRTELTTVSARLEQTTTERRQLIEERAALRTALAEVRQRASQNDVSHAATVGQLQAEATELQRQVAALSGDRTNLSERLQRTVDEGRELARRLAETQRRADELGDLLRQRDAGAATATVEREQLTAEVATLTGQLRASQEALERTQARAVQERGAFEAQHAAREEQSVAAQAELARRTETVLVLERELRSTEVARDAAATELQVTQEDQTRLAALVDLLRRSLAQAEADRDGAAAGGTALRRTLDTERAARLEAERSLRGDLTTARTEVERLAAAATLLRNEVDDRARMLAERDEQLAAEQREIESLRQESADRGILAHQASELGQQVVELEQQLAAVRGEAARAERQWAALGEELDTVRRQQADAAANIAGERQTMHDELQRVHDDRRRLEAEAVTLRGELQAHQAAQAELQAALEQAHQERARALENEQQAARLLDNLNGALQQREAALAAAASGRQQLVAQLQTVKSELRSTQTALEAAHDAAMQERSKLVADRDTWQQQARSARAEVDQLSAALDDLQQRAAHLDQARASAATDVASLRHTLEQERAQSLQTTGALQTDLAAARATAQQLSADAAALRDAVAEREAELAAVRTESDATQQALSEAQRNASALRTEVARLSAQVDERAAECQQLRDARAAVERQMTLVTAAHGEEEQSLAHGLQAAREQIAGLEAEAAALRVTLSESRQQLKAAEAAQTAALEQSHTGSADLRKQLATLKASGNQLTKRLKRTEQALGAQSERADVESQRAARLTEHTTQLELAVATREAQQTELDRVLRETQVTVSGLRAAHEAQTAELRQLRSDRTTLEEQLHELASTRGDEAQQLSTQVQTARAQLRERGAERTALQSTLHEVEERSREADEAHAATVQRLEGDAAAVRAQLAELSTAHADVGQRLQRTEQTLAQRGSMAENESRRATALAEQCAQLEQSVTTTEARRTALHAELGQARLEIEALRQHSADRGVLAHQAGELGTKVVALEQQIAAVRGDAAQAERQRAALAEELEAARRLQAQAEVVGDRKLATLRDAIDRLTEERRRLEALNADRTAEADAQRTTLAELQAALDQLRGERAQVDEQGQDLAQRLGEAHRRLDDLSTQVRNRDAAIDAAAADRSRLSAQVAKLTGQLRANQEAIEGLQGRHALERSDAEAERDRWREEAHTAHVELETLLASTDEVTLDASQAAAARAAAEAEMESVRRTLEQERATRQQMEEAVRAEVTAVRSDVAHIANEAAAVREQLLERETQITALLQEQEAAHQAHVAWQQSTAAARAEISGLNARCEAASGELLQLREERERMEQQLTQLASARGEETQVLTQQLQAAAAQIRAVERDRAMLQATLDEHQQRTRTLASTHAGSVDQMQASAEELRKQVAELNAGRVQLSERMARAEQELVARADQLDDRHRQAATLAERCTQLEQMAAAAESRRTAADGDLAQARTEIDALRALTAERGALADHAGELGSRVVDLEQQLAALRGEAARVDRQRTALAEELQAAHAMRAELAAAAETEQTRLREKLQQLAEERKRIEALQAQQQTELETHRASLTELHATIEQARDERLRFEQDGQDLAQQLGEAHTRLEELSAQLRQRDTAIDAAAADRKRLEDAVRAAETAAQMLSAERDEAPRPPQRAAGKVADENDAPADALLVIEHSAPLSEVIDTATDAPDSVSTDVPEPVASAEPVRELVLLDSGKRGEDAYAALRGAGFDVSIAAPIEKSVDDLAQRHISCVMINLAAGPAAWRTLKALRQHEGTRTLPTLAYIMPPDGQKGFCFRRADFGFWPTDPEDLIQRLGLLRPKLKRLLAVSADIDGMGKLRDPLAKAGISTSIVLDGKQALEFTTIVAPEAGLFHLSPQTPAIARAIAGIRAQDSTADLPLLLLLDKAPPREEIFFAATVRELLVKGTFHFGALPSEIARVIA